MQTMFKVVSVLPDGTKTSCAITRGQSCIEYKEGKWTTKKKYGPLVFASKERAQDFMFDSFPYSAVLHYYEVWECDAENARRCDYIMSPSDVMDLSSEAVRERMNDVVADTYAFIRKWAPFDTYITSRIRLTHRVD